MTTHKHTITLKFRIYRRTDGNGEVEYFAKRKVGFFWVWFTEENAGILFGRGRAVTTDREALIRSIQKYADRVARTEYYADYCKRSRKTLLLEIEEPTAVTGTFTRFIE